MAATGSLASTGTTTLAVAVKQVTPRTPAANHGAPFALDATVVTPLGQVGTPAHLSGAPIAKTAVGGPLSPPAHSAQPAQLPAHQQSVVRVGVSNNTSGASPAASSQPAPAPTPYQIYDSVTPQLIPAGQNVATYATGGYAVPASQVAGRGNVLWIDTQGTDTGAQALDVEPGDATPSVAASWAYHKLSQAPGAVARIYTMISEWPAVRTAIAALPQQMQSRVHYWIADPTGYAHVVPGSDATQWYWGKSWDISTALPGF